MKPEDTYLNFQRDILVIDFYGIRIFILITSKGNKNFVTILLINDIEVPLRVYFVIF